ncbi:Site-specific recombinase XerD [Desulfomicrobium apsheronum]|uniref:Site-specific recombinase XerD n=1 Tax=Desulfomicrobium apsheronum TaxID=52560 RepID=A0A1I3ZZV6_9BACT|nr:site-specific integrase [Desulfomicrobium apsheronum]SFK49221.1 Site-specific recombinase XerD [Desulfomicrobium apsheronum]
MSVYFDEKRKVWRYDFVMNRVRYHASQFKTKSAAREAEADKRKEVKTLLKNPPPEKIDMGFLELVNRRLDYVQAYNSERHYSDLRYMAKRWVAEWGKKAADEITPEMVQKFILKRAKKSSHVGNKEIRFLRALFNHAKKWKWLKDNPTDGLPFLPVEKKLKYVPRPEDIEAIISLADPETQDYLNVIRFTMARMSEINRLTWDDVNLEERFVALYTRKKRGGHLTPRKVPMTEELFQILNRRFHEKVPDRPWVFWHRYFDRNQRNYVVGPYKDRKRIMTTLCKRANVKYFRYHALRHSGASILESLNVPIVSIQKILGHENRSTTEVYLHSMDGSERFAMEAFGQKLCHKSPTQSPTQ